MNNRQTGTKNYFEGELIRLQKSALDADAKKQIRSFLAYGETARNYSYNRLYFHAGNLRALAGSMKEAFLAPTSQDVIDALAYQKGRANLSEWTIEGYKASLKVFYKWLKMPEVVADIKYQGKGKINSKRKPDFRISIAEADLLVQAADNARDKAIISLLYDSGIRIGELLTLRVGDVLFDDYGFIIAVNGKTGNRNVRVLGDSVGYVKAWINVHPDPFNPDAWLFCGIGHDMRGRTTITEGMNHQEIYAMLKKIKARAVILGFPPSKRINPHKFRHNRATELAPKLPSAILDKVMGWNLDSKMPAVYLHLNDEETDFAILKARGVKVEKKQPEARKTLLCIRCKTINPGNSKFCLQCGRPLDFEEARILQERSQEITDKLMSSDLVNATEKSIIEGISPDAQEEILLVLLEELKKSGKFQNLKNMIKS
ncbi:MAG: site-specific integrase [Thermoplasmatales archaeon]